MLEVVGGRQRLLAEIVERKARHPHRRLRHPHDVALHHQFMRRAGVPPASRRQASSSAASAVVIGRHVPGRHAGELFQPEIDARVEPHDLAVLLAAAR